MPRFCASCRASRKLPSDEYGPGMATPSTFSGPTAAAAMADRKSTRLNSNHGYISYAVFCLKKKKNLVSVAQSLRRTVLKQDQLAQIAVHQVTQAALMQGGCHRPRLSHMSNGHADTARRDGH